MSIWNSRWTIEPVYPVGYGMGDTNAAPIADGYLDVATGHGRDAIGIDLDPRNADLAVERVGPLMLTVEHHARDHVA